MLDEEENPEETSIKVNVPWAFAGSAPAPIHSMDQASHLIMFLMDKDRENLEELVEKIQAEASGKKMKIFPSLKYIEKKDHGKKVIKEIELEEKESLPDTIDFGSIESSISEYDPGKGSILPELDEKDDENEKDRSLKIYLPDPYGVKEVNSKEDLNETMMGLIKKEMPSFLNKLSQITVEAHGKTLEPELIFMAVPLRDFIKQKRIMALRIRALSVLRNHFELRAFLQCPSCGILNKEKTLNCDRCGHVETLNKGLKNI